VEGGVGVGVGTAVIARKATSTNKRRPAQYASEVLLELRQNAEIAWNWIVDETRDLDSGPLGAPTVLDWSLHALGQSHIDPWDGTPPMTLTEFAG
jgi:hypothetical protein